MTEETAVPSCRTTAVGRSVMAQSTRQTAVNNVRTMVTRLEKAATQLEKEFERQLKALDRARTSLRKEARKQIEAIRREQRGLVSRLKQATRPTSTTSTRRTTARRSTTTARRSPAKRAP